MADLQRARQPRAHYRLLLRRLYADLNSIQKYMDKWAEKYGPEAAARIAEIVLKD